MKSKKVSNAFELNSIPFVLSVLKSNSKLLLDSMNYMVSTFKNDCHIYNMDKLNNLLDDLQIFADNNKKIESELMEIENNYNNKNINIGFSNHLSDLQPQIADLQSQFYILMSKLLHYIGNNKLSTNLNTNTLSSESSFLQSNNSNIESNSSNNKESHLTKFEFNKQHLSQVLIISEKDNKVTLPYTGEQISLSNYKYSSISRFREAFKLMRYKEHKSFLSSINLGFELMSRYDLNPAVITACKNIDELDIYISCIDNNIVEEFPFFDIKYEINPI